MPHLVVRPEWKRAAAGGVLSLPESLRNIRSRYFIINYHRDTEALIRTFRMLNLLELTSDCCWGVRIDAGSGGATMHYNNSHVLGSTPFGVSVPYLQEATCTQSYCARQSNIKANGDLD